MHCCMEHAAARALGGAFPLDGTLAWPLRFCKLQGQLHAVHGLTMFLRQSCLRRQPEGTPVNPLDACAALRCSMQGVRA